MKKYLYLVICMAIMAGITTSCEEKIIDLVVKINDTFIYFADNNGSFTETHTASRDEVLDDFDYDVSGVQDVNISYVELEIEPNAGNQASRIRASGTFSDNSTPGPVFIFENFEFDVAEYTGAPKPVTGYQAAGINAMAEKLKGYINESDASDFIVQLTGTAIDGSGNPVNEDIRLTMRITLDAEVIFQEEASLPSFP